jgi:hypothetical protein
MLVLRLCHVFITLFCSNLKTSLELVNRFFFEFAFNFVLFFKRQPHIMNDLGWTIFGHKLSCRELDSAQSELPVCLEYVRERVLKEALTILFIQQALEIIASKFMLKYYWFHLLRKWNTHQIISRATIQLIQPPEYSDDDLSGTVPLLPAAYANVLLAVVHQHRVIERDVRLCTLTIVPFHSDLPGDIREIAVQMIYISCYGVFQPWLVALFFTNVRAASCTLGSFL